MTLERCPSGAHAVPECRTWAECRAAWAWEKPPETPALSVLDVCSGLGGWTGAFRDRGHRVETVDIAPRFNPTHVADITAWRPSRKYDVVLASPPCQLFSNARARWGYPPELVAEYLGIARAALEICVGYSTMFWVLENPRARLRRNEPFTTPRETVYYCGLGEPAHKPTDLWGSYPEPLDVECVRSNHVSKPLSNGRMVPILAWRHGDDRALIPYALSYLVCLQAERAAAGGVLA